jgi:competence protein ComEC
MWSQPAPPGWAVVAGLAGSAWLLAPAGVPARWLGLVACLPLLLLQPARPAAGEAWLDVIDVGQGQAVLVRTQAHALLYDAGPAYPGEGDAGSRIVVPHLRALGVRRLDRLIVSHDDNDHSGGADSVLDAVPVEQVLSSAAGFATLSSRPASGQRCARGQSWTWDGVGFDVLHPDSGDYNREAVRDNDLSCVLRVRSAHHTALLSGDIERASEAALLRRVPGDLRADVLLAPHHGSATSSSIGFLRHVQPQIAIFTVGHRNRFGHPAGAVVERYAGVGAVRYRSDRHGAIEVRMGTDLGVRAWRETHRRYWQGR